MKDSKLHKEINEIRKRFSELGPASNRTFFAGILKEGLSSKFYFDQPCHAQLKDEYTVLASGFGPNKDELEVAERFWSFISDTSISPWKYIFELPVERLYNKKTGLPTGFLLHPDLMESVNFSHIKSFCILTRVVTEKHNSFVFWDDVVTNYGLDPRDALYLCSYYVNNNGVVTSPLNTNINGWHWPLYDQATLQWGGSGIDWNRFYSGEVSPTKEIPEVGQSVNNSFLRLNEDKKYVSFGNSKYFNLKVRLKKGRFSTSSYYDTEEIVNAFLNWKKEYVEANFKTS